MNKKIAIVGAGGHGKVVGEIALLNQYEIINFFDDKENEIKEFPFTISGNLNYLKEHLEDYDAFFVAIGDNRIRSDIMDKFRNQKMNIIPLPKVIFKHGNQDNAENFFGKTAYYDPNSKTIVLFY